MTRHFLRLYLLVVLAIAGVSWSQEQLWLAFSKQDDAANESLATPLVLVERQLKTLPAAEWEAFVASLADEVAVEVELLPMADIAGPSTLAKLAAGEIAHMQAGREESWLLKKLNDHRVLAVRRFEPETTRGMLEWSLALLFYAAIALVIMVWVWPLTRDLRALESATASFGNRNWLFRADIKRRSQVYPLAETFRKMAARIDGLIGSHKDMSNAVSHEIKTPLARMQFELELAQNAAGMEQVRQHLHNIKGDIADLNALVTATLDYAILERADLALNLAAHDFTKIVPAVADYVRRDTRPDLAILCDVQADATEVMCDAHLLETALKNLLYNASRYASQKIQVAFRIADGAYQLTVDDDGPGIPEQDRHRVFGSFVQLGKSSGKKTGFGLGLAIVKRAFEWHGGSVAVLTSPLGGARFVASWPMNSSRV